jgi:glutamyl-tRNA synthetase
MQPFRLSLVGALKGHLFDIVELIGKEETIKRIQKRSDIIQKKPPM